MIKINLKTNLKQNVSRKFPFRLPASAKKPHRSRIKPWSHTLTMKTLQSLQHVIARC